MALVDAMSSASSGAGSVSSLAWSHTCSGANRGLVVDVVGVTQVVTSVQYNGVALTQLTSVGGMAGLTDLSRWFLTAPASGTHTITVTFFGGTIARAAALSFTSVRQASPFLINTNATRGTSSASTSVTQGVTAGTYTQLLLDVLATVGAATATPGAGQTVQQVVNSKLRQSIKASTVTANMSYTWTPGSAYAAAGNAVEDDNFFHAIGVATFDLTVLGVSSSGIASVGVATFDLILLSPTWAALRHKRHTITDFSRHGRFLSVSLETIGDGPEFELYAIDLDFSLRALRVWKDIP